MKNPLTFRRWMGINSLLLLFLIIGVVFFSVVGLPWSLFSDLFQGHTTLYTDIFLKARVPRVLLALFVGAGLSVSGTTFQSLLRNPLADPYILGVSGGAALGAVLALVLGITVHLIPFVGFVFALGALFLIYALASVDGRLPVHTLLLTGVIFNSFSFALILLINSLASFEQTHQIIYLLMGSLEAGSISGVMGIGLFVFLGFLILFFNSSKMNLVSLGEEGARQLGLHVQKMRLILFVAASLIVGACVAMAGLIGFVGLFVPHMMRLLWGPDHRLLLPASFLGGGLFLIVSDYLARALFSSGTLQTQVPVGVITALIGGPFFVYLMRRGKV